MKTDMKKIKRHPLLLGRITEHYKDVISFKVNF